MAAVEVPIEERKTKTRGIEGLQQNDIILPDPRIRKLPNLLDLDDNKIYHTVLTSTAQNLNKQYESGKLQKIFVDVTAKKTMKLLQEHRKVRFVRIVDDKRVEPYVDAEAQAILQEDLQMCLLNTRKLPSKRNTVAVNLILALDREYWNSDIHAIASIRQRSRRNEDFLHAFFANKSDLAWSLHHRYVAATVHSDWSIPRFSKALLESWKESTVQLRKPFLNTPMSATENVLLYQGLVEFGYGKWQEICKNKLPKRSRQYVESYCRGLKAKHNLGPFEADSWRFLLWNDDSLDNTERTKNPR